MRDRTLAAAVLVALMSASCGGGGGVGGPSARDIDNSLEATLRAVAGGWSGIGSGANGIRLEFTLQEAANGQVSGSGTMQENSSAAVVPITVSGTFQRPLLTLAFDGMVVDARPVKGAAQGSYTTVGGIATTLTLTAPGYARNVPVLLQEK